MGWEDTTAPNFAAQQATEGERAANGGRHPAQEMPSYGKGKTGIAQTSGAELAENDGDTN